MKGFVQAAAFVIVVLLTIQSYETASARAGTFSCAAAEAELLGCISLGPLGAVNPAHANLWFSSFVEHGKKLPNTAVKMLRNMTHRSEFERSIR
jgi:hypothetical protein